MTLDLSALDGVNRLLFSIPLEPLQGHRFQPTGFPALGAATFSSKYGPSLLVESAQSMANRLELTIWDEAKNDVKEEFEGLSHIRVKQNDDFLTDSILESHRINSPYILSDKKFHSRLTDEIAYVDKAPVNRKSFVEGLLKYDIGSLLHGVFLEKIAGRLRISRAVEAFIEADNIHIAASGGVKNDRVFPSGEAKKGFGNVPFARDEYTSDSISLFMKIDLAQIRGYGLNKDFTKLLIILSLYKIRALLDRDLRLRTACDFQVTDDTIIATKPAGFILPSSIEIMPALRASIAACKDFMVVEELQFTEELKKAKDNKNDDAADTNETDDEN